MTALKQEVQGSLYTLLDRLDRFTDPNPEMVIDDAADDFNLILRAAKAAFPASETVQALRPLDPGQPLISLMTRVSTLKGAVDAAVASEAQ